MLLYNVIINLNLNLNKIVYLNLKNKYINI